MAEALPASYSRLSGFRRTSPARRGGRTGIRGSLAAQQVGADTGGDPGRRIMHGIPREVGVARALVACGGSRPAAHSLPDETHGNVGI